MSIIQLIVVLALVGLALWAVGQFPMDATIMKIIRVVVIVIVVLWVLEVFGLLPNTSVPRLHNW